MIVSFGSTLIEEDSSGNESLNIKFNDSSEYSESIYLEFIIKNKFEWYEIDISQMYIRAISISVDYPIYVRCSNDNYFLLEDKLIVTGGIDALYVKNIDENQVRLNVTLWGTKENSQNVEVVSRNQPTSVIFQDVKKEIGDDGNVFTNVSYQGDSSFSEFLSIKTIVENQFSWGQIDIGNIQDVTAVNIQANGAIYARFGGDNYLTIDGSLVMNGSIESLEVMNINNDSIELDVTVWGGASIDSALTSYASIQVDLQIEDEQPIWVVPAGKRFIPVRVLLRDLTSIPDQNVKLYYDETSGSDMKVSASVFENAYDSVGGFVNNMAFDVFSSDSLSGNYLTPRPIGEHGQSLIFKMDTGTSSACTAIVDVFGFLVKE